MLKVTQINNCQHKRLKQNNSAKLSTQEINTPQNNQEYPSLSKNLLNTYFIKRNNVTFSGTPTNFNVVVNKKVAPLVIEPNMDFDYRGIPHYFPGLKCEGGDWSGSKIQERFFKKAQMPNSKFIKTDMLKAKFPKANLVDSDFSDAYAVSADFRKADLEDSVFDGANIKNANFQNANLKYVDFRNTHMPNVNLMGADMSNAKFNSNTVISKAIYDDKTIFPHNFDPKIKIKMYKMEKDGNLKKAVFHRAHLISEDLYQKDLSGIDFSDAKFRWSNIHTIDFSKSNFANSFAQDTIFASVGFQKANLKGAEFDRCNFQHAQFDDANLDGTLFKDSVLITANFKDCDLSRAEFEGKCLYDVNTKWPEGFEPNKFQGKLKDLRPGVNLSDMSLKKVKLRQEDITAYELNLEKINFTKADLSEAWMMDLNMKECKFKKAYMRETILTGSDLEKANFSKANLEGANLSDTNCKDADFTWTNLNKAITDGADFTGAKYSEDTIFPEGFDPKSEGMIKVGL